MQSLAMRMHCTAPGSTQQAFRSHDAVHATESMQKLESRVEQLANSLQEQTEESSRSKMEIHVLGRRLENQLGADSKLKSER